MSGPARASITCSIPPMWCALWCSGACALGVDERGRELANRMRAEAIDGTTASVTPPAILVEWWPKPVIVPGRHSWVSDMITLVGGTNPWAQRNCKSTPITDEEVIAAAPDALVLSWCGVKPEKVRPDIVQKRVAWRHVPAVVKGHIYCVPEAWMGRPGPRLLDGLRALRAIVTQVTV